MTTSGFDEFVGQYHTLRWTSSSGAIQSQRRSGIRIGKMPPSQIRLAQ